MFERFLNKERVSMPDIDVDFPDNQRHEVIKHIQISTVMTMSPCNYLSNFWC